jgi:hypothetical protein
MARRTNPIVVVKEIDLDTSRIYICNHMVGMDKISSNESLTWKFNEEVQSLSSFAHLLSLIFLYTKKETQKT